MSHHPLQQPTLDQFSAHTARLARRCNLSTSIDDSLLQIESTNDDPKDDEIAQTPQRSHARAAKSFEEQRDVVPDLSQISTFLTYYWEICDGSLHTRPRQFRFKSRKNQHSCPGNQNVDPRQ
ncbi:hypothetical protein BLNAU_8517 [Blattamonas nauphoetae]|uniref:Uncharacterized protein n=1 Tax=Blattamonas nauphoetae TaxID=2049346 RepID=A0ABQ9XY96_9EUKA|nr:hypothetical protein BLNAU_8517 [Blattamonas nauphoetae]